MVLWLQLLGGALLVLGSTLVILAVRAADAPAEPRHAGPLEAATPRAEVLDRAA